MRPLLLLLLLASPLHADSASASARASASVLPKPHSFWYYFLRIGGCAAVDYATTQWVISKGGHEVLLWKDQRAHAAVKLVGSMAFSSIAFSFDRRQRHGSAKAVMLSSCGVFLSAAAWNTTQALKSPVDRRP